MVETNQGNDNQQQQDAGCIASAKSEFVLFRGRTAIISKKNGLRITRAISANAGYGGGGPLWRQSRLAQPMLR
jgi:hypothetical protein